mgnify:FL=1
MTKDTIDQMFKNLDEYYPGSKKKRRVKEVSKKVVDKEDWEAQGVIKKLSNGKEIELFSAGSLSLALGRPLVTVRLWERRGYIPKAPYRLKSMIVKGEKKPGWRMYSRAMIESAMKSFQSRGLLEAPRIDWNRHHDLSIELIESWTKIHANETANGNGNDNAN